MADISCNFKNTKYFWRGSTPTYIFKFAIELSKFAGIEIGFSQDDNLVIKKELGDCAKRDEHTFSLTLKKDETMKFHEGNVTLQLQVSTDEDGVVPSSPHSLFCKDTVFSKANKVNNDEYY